jgi:hypothetical protein
MTGPAARVAVLIFLVLAGWVAWQYSQVEGPHAIVLLLALAIWLVCFTLAAIGLGAPLWRWVSGEPLGSTDSLLVSAAAGAAGMMALAGLLGGVGWLDARLLLATMGLGAVCGAFELRRATIGPRTASIPWMPAIVLALGGLVTLLAVATPSPFYDQVHYHLAFPERWLQAGSIDVFPRHAYSFLPANMGLLYVYALAGPGVWAAQAMHWWMGLVAAAAAFLLARQVGAGIRGGAWAAAVLVATPSVLLCATWAASDLGVAAFGGVACLMALDPVAKERARGTAWYALCGALSGIAFGCKYLALATVAVPVGVILAGAGLLAASRARKFRPALAIFIPWGLGLSFVVLPWTLRNTILTGNPVYPFYGDAFAGLFGSPILEQAGEAAQRIAPAETASAIAAALSLRTFEPLGAAGIIGPLWLMLIPLWLGMLLFGKREKAGLLLAASVLTGIVVWSQFRQLGRYLLPVLVPAAAGIGFTLERTMASMQPRLRNAVAVLLGFVMLWSFQGGISELTFKRISCTFGRSDTRELLERHVSYWPALDVVNHDLPLDAKLLLVGESRALHLDRQVMLEDPFRTPYLLELARGMASPGEMTRSLQRDGITHVLYNEHEANRIARMGRRSGYFSDAQGDVQVRLHTFLSECLELIETAGPVRVYRLGEACGES